MCPDPTSTPSKETLRQGMLARHFGKINDTYCLHISLLSGEIREGEATSRSMGLDYDLGTSSFHPTHLVPGVRLAGS